MFGVLLKELACKELKTQQPITDSIRILSLNVIYIFSDHCILYIQMKASFFLFTGR